MLVSHTTVMADVVQNNVPYDLDTVGNQRFSGAPRSQGRTSLLIEKPSKGLIQMDDWCVSQIRHRPKENEGAYGGTEPDPCGQHTNAIHAGNRRRPKSAMAGEVIHIPTATKVITSGTPLRCGNVDNLASALTTSLKQTLGSEEKIRIATGESCPLTRSHLMDDS